MREIKFRAWDKSSNIMIPNEGILMINGEFKVGVWNFEETEIVNEHDFKLMQFTGLLDKNGKEIYEGDIVIGTFTYAENCLVIWDEKRCGFYLKPLEGFAASDKYLKMNSCKLEIIGNIYSNPDLLSNPQQ